ncbi:MAG: type II toxin-antitoxin system ParD family antitoxin [Deferribacterales bacterium]
MSTMNVSLPESMKKWAESQVKTGKYSNTSDYIRDLIRNDQEITSKTNTLIMALELGEQSGISENNLNAIYNSVKADV